MQKTKAFTPLTLFIEFCPFIIFSMETGPLYNTKTVADVFTKLGSITVILQWLEQAWDHEKIFETGVVRANEC